MNFLINLLCITIACVAQISLMPKIVILGGFPNLVLITILIMLFYGRNTQALWWAGIGGIILDLLSPVYFGLFTGAFLIIYILTSFLTKRIFPKPSIFIAIIFFMIASIVLDLPFLYFNLNFKILLVNIIYNTGVGCIIYLFAKSYSKAGAPL